MASQVAVPSNFQFQFMSFGALGALGMQWTVDLIKNSVLGNPDLLTDLTLATFPGYAQQVGDTPGLILPDMINPFYYCDLVPVTFLCTSDDTPLVLSVTGYVVCDAVGSVVWAEVWDPIYWVYGATAGEEWILQLRQLAYWIYP